MQISNKNRNSFWPMQYVFLIRCRAGCKKYVTRLCLVMYFLPPAVEFYLYPTVGTVLIHSIKPELTE